MIPSFKEYLVEEKREIYFTFGRMNPPTVGHGKLMDALSAKAGKNPYKVFVSQSQDKNKNPLPYTIKLKHIRKMFNKHARNIILNKKINTVMDALVNLYDQGYKNVSMIVGSDRIAQFETLLNKYNGVKSSHGFYNFETIKIISAGARDPDSDGAEGASATKQRAAAKDNDFTTFSQGLPQKFSNRDAKSLFNDVRAGMGLKEEAIQTNKLEFEPISDIREKYFAGELFEPGDRVIIKESKKRGVIHRLGTNYVIVSLDEGKISRQWIDAIILEKNQPEWGTPASTKKAKSMTPGEGITVGKLLRARTEEKDDSEVERIKAKISKEKQADRVKHDRMLDRASVRAARVAALKSKPKL
jgi:hypothetical protein